MRYVGFLISACLLAIAATAIARAWPHPFASAGPYTLLATALLVAWGFNFHDKIGRRERERYRSLVTENEGARRNEMRLRRIGRVGIACNIAALLIGIVGGPVFGAEHGMWIIVPVLAFILLGSAVGMYLRFARIVALRGAERSR